MSAFTARLTQLPLSMPSYLSSSLLPGLSALNLALNELLYCYLKKFSQKIMCLLVPHQFEVIMNFWSYGKLQNVDLQLFFPYASVSMVSTLNLKENAFHMNTTPFKQHCKLLSLFHHSSTNSISLVHKLEFFHTWILSYEFFSVSHLKQHCSGDIKEIFKSVSRSTFQCLPQLG